MSNTNTLRIPLPFDAELTIFPNKDADGDITLMFSREATWGDHYYFNETNAIELAKCLCQAFGYKVVK